MSGLQSAKRIGISLLSLLLLGLLLLTGCGQKQEQEKKIVIWHWMTDREDAFDELAQRYTAEKEIEVEFKLFFPPDIYSQKVIAAARAGNLPEIFGILGEKKTVGSFINAGHIINLTPFMQEDGLSWQNSFYPQTLETVTFIEKNSYSVPPGIYGVPIDTTVMQFIYNKELLQKGGLDPDVHPQTFEDFVAMAQKLKETLGVNGFVCGWGEGWLLNALATEWAINLMGEDKFQRTIAGEVPYTDPEWIKVFSFFLTLRESGILAPNIATMINKESEDAFAKGKAAFSFNGSWSVNVYNQLAPDLEYAFFNLPKVSDQYPVKIWGGAGSAFMVSAQSPQRDQAVKFLRWLTSKEQQQFLIRETNNLPAIKGCEETLIPVLKSLVDTLDILTHPNIWPYNEDSRVIEVMNRGLQQIVMGLKSPPDVAGEIQKVKERVSRR